MQSLKIDHIKANLKTTSFGQRLYYFDQLGSTSDHLKGLAVGKVPEGTIVVAEEQRAGRGRQGNSWYSPAGTGLYFSLLLRPRTSPDQMQGLTLALGCSAAKTLEKAGGLPVEIKWPNDIYCGGRKLGGILTESEMKKDQVGWLIIGVGLNLNNRMLPLELCRTATSLGLESGRHIHREDLLISLLTDLEKDYLKFKEQGLAAFADEIKARFYLDRKKVVVSVDGGLSQKGVVTGFDDQGALLLLDQDGQSIRCLSGTVAEVS